VMGLKLNHMLRPM